MVTVTGKLEHSFSYREIECYVVLRSYGKGAEAVKYRCGYIALPVTTAYFDTDEIMCHDTITYSSSYSPDSVPQDNSKYYIGFDCAHLGDTIDCWTIERVRMELRHIVNQILKQESEE